MNEVNVKKKGNLGLFIVIGLLVVILLCMVGYLVWDSVEKNNNHTNNNNGNSGNISDNNSGTDGDLVVGDRFRTSDYQCTSESDDTCFMNIKVSYGEKNHVVTLRRTSLHQEDYTTVSYDVSIDDVSVRNFVAGDYYDGNTDQEKKDLLNDINLFIVDGKYLAIGYTTLTREAGGTGVKVDFYNNSSYVDTLTVKDSLQGIYNDGAVSMQSDKASDIYFIESNFRFFAQNCEDGVVYDYSASFDGERISVAREEATSYGVAGSSYCVSY